MLNHQRVHDQFFVLNILSEHTCLFMMFVWTPHFITSIKWWGFMTFWGSKLQLFERIGRFSSWIQWISQEFHGHISGHDEDWIWTMWWNQCHNINWGWGGNDDFDETSRWATGFWLYIQFLDYPLFGLGISSHFICVIFFSMKGGSGTSSHKKIQGSKSSHEIRDSKKNWDQPAEFGGLNIIHEN